MLMNSALCVNKRQLFVGCKLEVLRWIVTFVQDMYNYTMSREKLDNSFTDEFGEKVDVHQRSVLSPLLFIMVLEALSCQFRTGTSWELLYIDDPVIIAESEGKFRRKLRWMSEMEKKGLRINIRKTKVDPNLNSLKDF